MIVRRGRRRASLSWSRRRAQIASTDQVEDCAARGCRVVTSTRIHTTLWACSATARQASPLSNSAANRRIRCIVSLTGGVDFALTGGRFGPQVGKRNYCITVRDVQALANSQEFDMAV